MLAAAAPRPASVESRVTCPLCNGTGDVPSRVERAQDMRRQQEVKEHVRFETMLAAMKKITRARDLLRVQEICSSVEQIVWKVR
jgi:hypothetical protein